MFRIERKHVPWRKYSDPDSRVEIDDSRREMQMAIGMSVKEFQKRLKEELEAIAAAERWNLDNNVQRGWTFQLWVARVISRFEMTFETAPEDSLLRSKDLKADLVFDDPSSRHLLICQCKRQPFNEPVDESEVNDFFHRHEHLLDRQWVIKHGSADARLALQDYKERLDNGYSVTYYFFSTGDASPRTAELATTCGAEYRKRGIPIDCQLLDFKGIKDYFIRSLSLEESIPEVVEIDLPSDQFFFKQRPYPTLVAVIKGNSLRNLSQTFKQALYTWNIRGYLGKRGINQDISDTAQKEPENFFYYNNGVSAICTDLEIKGNRLTAKKFQIINGAQTVSTLANLEANAEVEVLFRLTKTQSVSTEKQFNREIIHYNNSQNAIKLSDFRSNEPIQIWLERAFTDLRHHDAVPRMHYVRKRSVGRKGTGPGLRLEELAKIRYAWFYEPTAVHAAPKNLWTPEEDGGLYERSFGVDGEIQDAWSDETFDETLLAISLAFRITEESKRLATAGADLKFLPRLRFHTLALAGIYFRRMRDSGWRKLVRNEEALERFWGGFWPIAKAVLVDVYTAAEEEDATMFAFVRSTDRWAKMQKRFSRHLAGS